MIIRGNNLDDKLVIEIGRFSILWNCFERFQCNNACNPTKIKLVSQEEIKYKINLTEKGDIENLPLDILEPIAKALSTTPAFLMGWEKEQKNNQ